MVDELTVMPTPENLGDDIRRFSSEACDYLRERRLVIYSLSGKSIEELENESGIKLALTNTIRVDSSEFKKQRSIKSEVAIDPEEFFLEDTIDRPYHRLQRTSDTPSINAPWVKTIIGTVADYFALYIMHLRETGRDLFGIENNHSVAVAEFPLDKSKFAIMGQLLRDDDSLIAMVLPRDSIYPGQTLAPIMVPQRYDDVV